MSCVDAKANCSSREGEEEAWSSQVVSFLVELSPSVEKIVSQNSQSSLLIWHLNLHLPSAEQFALL